MQRLSSRSLLDSTCSITSCSICSYSDDSESEEEDEEEDASEPSSDEESNDLPSTSGANDVEQADTERPLRKLKKSLSADILNHPPLPRFPRYDVKRSQRSSTETTSSGGYVPPLPQVPIDKHSQAGSSKLETTSQAAAKKKNASTSNLTSELTFQNLSKFNYSSMDEFNNNPSVSSFNPNGNQLSVVEIIPKPSKATPDIDQTIGIPLTYDTVDNTGNAFYASLGPTQFNANNNHDVSNDYEYHQVPTTIHQYPLISGTIPSTTQAKMNYNTMPAPTISPLKKDPTPTGSILSNPSNFSSNNANGTGNKKENGEKNKVKFSDTITVAVVPEISRKEKVVNFNDRMKRKTVFPGRMDPRRELAESLPLCHPHEDYLKDFSPVSTDRSKDAPSTSKGSSEEKKKPTIKVVHFGVV